MLSPANQVHAQTALVPYCSASRLFQGIKKQFEQDSKECSFVLFQFLFLFLSLFLRRFTAWQSLCLAPCITQLHIETSMS